MATEIQAWAVAGDAYEKTCAELAAAQARVAELERERERFFSQQMETADWVQMSRDYQHRAEQAERDRDRLREALDEAIANQRCDTPGWFTWWTTWIVRAVALRGADEAAPEPAAR